MDVLPQKRVLMIMSGIMAFFIATLEVCQFGGLLMYFIWIAVLFLCVGGVCSVWAVVTMTYFGTQHFMRNFGLLITAAGAAYMASACAIFYARGAIGDIGDSVVAAVC